MNHETFVPPGRVDYGDLGWLLTSFTRRVPSIIYSLAVSVDGLAIASSDQIPPDEADQLAAITSGLASLTVGAAKCMSTGHVRQTVVDMDGGVLLVMAVADRAYLATIVEVLRMQSRLVHWRVLVGPPHRQVLKDHLVRLLDLRDPADRTYGMQTLHLGMMEDEIREPERFFVASESQAVVTIPSLTAASNFDTGILLAHPLQARALVEHAKQLYAGSAKLETLTAVEALPVLR